jgi:WD40 repeat protein
MADLLKYYRKQYGVKLFGRDIVDNPFLLTSPPLSQVLEGHSDFINDLVFHPKEGQELASVSDDHTCR